MNKEIKDSTLRESTNYCLERKEVIDILEEDYENLGNFKDRLYGMALKYAIDTLKALEQEPNTWNLDDARNDFMYDVYNTLDFLPTNEEANRIIDSFDRVTSSIKQEPCEDCISRKEVIKIIDHWVRTCNVADKQETPRRQINALPPMQPKRKQGKWIEVKSTEYDEFSVTDMKCNCCNRYASLVLPHGTICTYDFCPNCGTEMESER